MQLIIFTIIATVIFSIGFVIGRIIDKHNAGVQQFKMKMHILRHKNLSQEEIEKLWERETGKY